jgi:hypothetical protein
MLEPTTTGESAGDRVLDPRCFDGVVFDSYPRSQVENSQPAGIGRVVSLRERCAWNNLGRNVVFASASFRPEALFGQTVFPDEDEPSQYDLDVHAILEMEGAGIVVVLNHLGLLRAFSGPDLAWNGAVARLEPRWTSQFADDVERVVVTGDQLIGSRPRHDKAGGVIVSEPLTTDPGREVGFEAALEDWAVVTALGALSPDGERCIAVGDDRRVALFPRGERTLGSPRWEAAVGFQPAVLTWDGQLLWAAGSEPAAGVDDYDWERLQGGGFVGLDPADGALLVEGHFGDVAWGNGGAAVAVTSDLVCGIERRGGLSLHNKQDGSLLTRTPNAASRSLGIAHAAAVDDQLLFGFNRAGYTLCAVPWTSLRRLAGSPG